MTNKITSADVRPIRLQMVLTQKQFAAKHGWAERTVQIWEGNDNAAISIRNQQILIPLKKRYLK
jgi:DNA-binding transcriptional regulator YiaG